MLCRSNYINSLDASNLLIYESKIEYCYGIDPYEIVFETCETDWNLFSNIQHGDIVNYLVFSTSSATLQEMKAYKSREAHNFFTSGFVKQEVYLKTVDPKKVLLLGQSKSKNTGNKTQQNSNQGGYSKESKTFPSKSYGAKEEYNQGDRVTENAWGRSRHSSVSDMWSDPDEHFPTLGASAAPMPKVNVWEERKSKQEAIKALEPQNEYDEEAMLQHALAMSLLEATEEENKQKKIEDDYKMQLEALQSFPEAFDASDEFLAKEASNVQDDISTKKHHLLENCSRNSASVSSQNKKNYDCESSKFQDDFSAKEPYQLENCSRNSSSVNRQKGRNYDCEGSNFQDDFSAKEPYQLENSYRNSMPNNSQNEKTYNSEGARPKVNKAIAAFGGWGLKDNKKRTNSETISEFVDDVVSEKSNSYNKTYTNQKNKGKNISENGKSNEENGLHSALSKNVKKSAITERSDHNREILYDEKGTFVVDDGIWNGSENKLVSPNKVLDSWLTSEDVDDWNEEILNKEKVTTQTDNFIPTYSDKLKTEDDKKQILSTPMEFSIPTITNDYEPKIGKDSHILPQQTSESIKSVWSNTTNYEDQEPENKNAYMYDACDNANNFTPFHEPTEVPTLTSCKIWSDKSSSDSSYFSSYSDNLASKVESVKLSNDVENEVFNIVPCNDSDVPPIPPPQPPAVNECSASANAIPNSEVESPQNPHPVPEMQVPQFPTLVTPILNPMFPALNPMLGCGMDPLLMRQMLILSNPFLANQLLAMEQYYRSMGIPVDLFSMNSPMPNAPGILNPSLLQNPFASNVNGNLQQLQSEIQQLQTQIDASAASVSSTVENLEQKTSQTSHEPSRHDRVLDFNKPSASVENVNDDPWFKSYLSNDTESIIPPPKPPSDEVNLMSVPHKSESGHTVSSYDNKFAHSQTSDNSAVRSSVTNKDRPLSTFGACIPKKEVTGWGDLEDEFADAQNLKSHTWDDGWGDAVAPPKSLRNLSLQEDKKKTVFRQPAKQPQIGRYHRNFTHS